MTRSLRARATVLLTAVLLVVSGNLLADHPDQPLHTDKDAVPPRTGLNIDRYDDFDTQSDDLPSSRANDRFELKQPAASNPSANSDELLEPDWDFDDGTRP